MSAGPPGPPRGLPSLHSAGLGWGRPFLAAGQQSPGRDEQGCGPVLEAPPGSSAGRLGEGSPLRESGAACGGFVLCIKSRPQPDGVAVSPKPWGMPPSPRELPRWPWALVGGGSLCAPHPCPRAGGTEEGGVLGGACVLGFGSGVRRARRAWGAQACCRLLSCLPALACARSCSTAWGPVPTRSLPPECPGLSSAQTRQGPPGPPVLSVSVSPPLPAPLHPPRPHICLTSAHPAVPQIPTHRVTGHLHAHRLQPLIPQPQGQWHPAQPRGAGPPGSPSRSHSC